MNVHVDYMYLILNSQAGILKRSSRDIHVRMCMTGKCAHLTLELTPSVLDNRTQFRMICNDKTCIN